MWPLALAGAAVGGLLYLRRNKESAPEEQRPTPKRKPFVPPISGITPQQWKAFMLSLGDKANVASATPSGHLGFFRFGMPRLADLGLACNVRRDAVDGKKVWVGDFVPPLTRDQFLGSLGLQSRVFALSSGDFATHIRESRPQDIGREIDGQKATLSGLLGVLHRAGVSGYEQWTEKPGDRKKYPHTTAAFVAANGIF